MTGSREAVRAALSRLDDLDARTNAVADRDDARVLDQADDIVGDGPLCGEPITVKDWIDVVGFHCSGGEVEHADRRPTSDASAIARLRAAGAVVIAKTTVGTESELFGEVRNPHDATRSPGGSSSGEAAAVGGGAVRLGIGSDSGGSIRVPAAWCGVVGFKPSAGLIPVTGHFPRLGDRHDGRSVIGPLADSVDLAWAAVQIMAGPDGLDGGVAPVELDDPDDIDVRDLRIAVGSPGERPVGGAVHGAMAQAGAAVWAAGATDAGAPPDWLAEAYGVTVAYWTRDQRTGAQVEQDLFAWDRFRRRAMVAMRGVDVLITPTVSEVAPRHRPMQRDDYVFCLPASLLGAPAISVPVGDSAVQVIAARWDDAAAVAVARVIEAAG